MITNNFFFYSIKILAELLIDVFYFPVWWYSRGLARTARALADFLADRERSLALFVWIKNIFKPMYGQYNWQGHLISFFVRLTQIIVRGAIMIVWLLVAILIFVIWLLLPLLVIYEIIFQLFL